MFLEGVVLTTSTVVGSAAGFRAMTRLLSHERTTRRLRHDIGPWLSMRDDLGLTDPLYVAQIAVIGPFPNPPGEALYLLARTDDAGRPLRAEQGCTLSLPASLPARFWSLSAYDAAGKFFPDPLSRSSVTHRSPRVGGELRVGPVQGGSVWLPTSDAGPLQLLLRLYEPPKDVWERLEGGAVPRIRCGS